MKVSVAAAKNQLPKLSRTRAAGDHLPAWEAVVDMVRTKKGKKTKRKFGAMKDKFIGVDPDWWKPMTEEEAEAYCELDANAFGHIYLLMGAASTRPALEGGGERNGQGVG